jgi:hypothetical protein
MGGSYLLLTDALNQRWNETKVLLDTFAERLSSLVIPASAGIALLDTLSTQFFAI